MKRSIAATVVAMAAISGCGGSAATRNPPSFNPPAPAANSGSSTPDHVTDPTQAQVSTANTASPAIAPGEGFDEPVAIVRGHALSMRELMKPLIESHGLTILLNLVQLELARQDAAQNRIVLSDKDFQDEHDAALEKLFRDGDDANIEAAIEVAEKRKDVEAAAKLRAQQKADREAWLTQFLDKQHIDRVEFDIVLKINAYLRKIAEPQVQGKISEEAAQRAFGQMYGERIEVEYIQVANVNDVLLAKQRLAKGDSFEQVARDMSLDRQTGALGGKLIPFTRETKIEQVFKDAAFSLKDGEISDDIIIGRLHHIIKRLHVIPPAHIKYEMVRTSVYKKLNDALLDSVIKQLKLQLAEQAKKEMQIKEPVLARQFDERVKSQARADQKAKDDLERQTRVEKSAVEALREKLHAATQPDTAPATEPAAPSTTQPAGTSPSSADAPKPDGAAAGERPPAPRPGTTVIPITPKLVPDTQPESK